MQWNQTFTVKISLVLLPINDQISLTFASGRTRMSACPLLFFHITVRPAAFFLVSDLVLVALHVQGQVVGAREAAAAGDALEGFGPGVFPVVPGQLVGPGEAPVAVVPRAAVRFLPWRRTEGLAMHVCIL